MITIRPGLKFRSISIFCFAIAGCNYFSKPKVKSIDSQVALNSSFTHSKANPTENAPKPVPEIEQTIINAGLIDIKTIDSTIIVDLKYSTPDNFLGMDVYGDLDKCYLQPDVAEKLKNASFYLKSKFPYYRIIVFDAVRPRSIQTKMWDTINIPLKKRSQYLTNPINGSLHNFGAAVDISLIDEHGNLLDMGTKYDYFGELAYPRKEELMLQKGMLNFKQLFNRELLREAMEKAGFFVATTEWWHFNSCNREEANSKYKIVE